MGSPILLVVIYIAFISLGLPDSSLGIAWPQFRAAIGAPLEAAGLIAVVLTICSALSSVASGWVNRRFGTGRVVALSCVLTATGLIGYSFAPSLAWVAVAAIPLGFGAGAVDSSLNAYVATHYASRHMNWLHASWGIGATIGPIIMSRAIASGATFRLGWRTIGAIQGTLALVFIATLGLWRNGKTTHDSASREVTATATLTVTDTLSSGLHKPEPWMQIASYALYAACESSVGIWTASLLVEARGATTAVAGALVSMYFGGIMAGRVLTGFVSDRLGNRRVVRMGLAVAFAGAALFCVRGPLWLTAPGLLLLGLGLAPIYPGLMHETPKRFGGSTYRSVIGLQVAAACLGASFFPGLVGLAASALGLELLGPAVAGFIVALWILIARLDAKT